MRADDQSLFCPPPPLPRPHIRAEGCDWWSGQSSFDEVNNANLRATQRVLPLPSSPICDAGSSASKTTSGTHRAVVHQTSLLGCTALGWIGARVLVDWPPPARARGEPQGASQLLHLGLEWRGRLGGRRWRGRWRRWGEQGDSCRDKRWEGGGGQGAGNDEDSRVQAEGGRVRNQVDAAK